MLAIDAFLDDLVACGYTGTVSLEVDLRRYLTEPKKLSALLNRMREDVRDEAGRLGRVAAQARYPRAVRRGTAITLAVLFVLLAAALIAQLRQPAPTQPYPGPASGTELPSPSPSG